MVGWWLMLRWAMGSLHGIGQAFKMGIGLDDLRFTLASAMALAVGPKRSGIPDLGKTTKGPD